MSDNDFEEASRVEDAAIKIQAIQRGTAVRNDADLVVQRQGMHDEGEPRWPPSYLASGQTDSEKIDQVRNTVMASLTAILIILLTAPRAPTPQLLSQQMMADARVAELTRAQARSRTL
jgi:hypothetical protein